MIAQSQSKLLFLARVYQLVWEKTTKILLRLDLILCACPKPEVLKSFGSYSSNVTLVFEHISIILIVSEKITLCALNPLSFELFLCHYRLF